METLDLIGEPATPKEIDKHIAVRWRYNSKEMKSIKRVVRAILRKGEQNGFIIRVGRHRYTTTAVLIKLEKRNADENVRNLYHNYLV